MSRAKNSLEPSRSSAGARAGAEAQPTGVPAAQRRSLPTLVLEVPDSDWYCAECAPLLVGRFVPPRRPDAVCRCCGVALTEEERRTLAMLLLADRLGGSSNGLSTPGDDLSAEQGCVPDLKARVAISIQEAAASLGCGRTRVFELLKEGKLKRAQKAGKATMVLASSLERYFVGQRQQRAQAVAPALAPKPRSQPPAATNKEGAPLKLRRTSLGDAIRKLPVK